MGRCAFCVHRETGGARSRVGSKLLLTAHHQRPHPLTMKQLAFAVFLEPGSITIPFRHVVLLETLRDLDNEPHTQHHGGANRENDDREKQHDQK